MDLYINTTQKNKIIIAIKEGDKFLCKKSIKTKYTEAEKLLLEIDKLIKKAKIELKDINNIEVENRSNEDTSFTALRIGVVTANALAYALKCRVNNSYVVEPIYSKEPNITKRKKQ